MAKTPNMNLAAMIGSSLHPGKPKPAAVKKQKPKMFGGRGILNIFKSKGVKNV